MTNYIDVTSFGIIPDGISCCVDDLTRIIARLPPNGGTLYFPPGDYAVSKTINIDRNGVSLRGAGVNSSRFFSDNPDHTYIRYGSPSTQVTHFSIQQLGFNTHVPRGEGAYLHLCNAFNGKISDCFFANPYIAVNVDNSSFIYMSDCMIVDPIGEVGLGVLVHGNGRHNDQYFTRVFVQSQDRSTPCAAGFRLANSQALWMTQCGAYHCNIGVQILATAGMTCEHLFFTDNHADNCVTDGWLIEAGASAVVRRLQFHGDWAASNGGTGWRVRSSGGIVDDISLLGVRSYANAGAGLHAESAELISLQNSTLAGNCLRGETSAEVVLNGGNGLVVIQANRIGSVSGLTSRAHRMIEGVATARRAAISNNIAVGLSSIGESSDGEDSLALRNEIIIGDTRA